MYIEEFKTTENPNLYACLKEDDGRVEIDGGADKTYIRILEKWYIGHKYQIDVANRINLWHILRKWIECQKSKMEHKKW